MASRKQSQQEVEVSKATNEDINRFRLGEMGVIGNTVFNGITYDEIKKELNFPESVNTYKLMSLHSSVNSPVNLFTNMVAKAPLRVVPPKNATEEEKKQAEIVESMFEDMEHTLEDFVRSCMTAMVYGFAPIEKVYRKRTYAAGSIYNDGLIGIKKLPLRNQKSIEKFIFDETGNEVKGLTQVLTGNDPYNRFIRRNANKINIPRDKFLLVTFGNDRNNPYGVSPLREVYLPWKYLQAIEELEALSVTKDLNGIPVLSVPVQYMSGEASPEQKAQLEVFKNIIRNLQQGSQLGIILPSAVDPETRKELFSISLLTQDGKRNNDLNKIKEYYRTAIYIGLGADILVLGTSSGTSSSFALGTIKNTLASNVAESYMRRIIDVVNNDLIRQIFELNGWDVSRRCKLDYEGFGQESLDEIGKFGQRMFSVGGMVKDLDTINYFRNALGLDPLDESVDLKSMLSDNTSRAGDGLATPFEGTRTSIGDGRDSSALNAENAS